jgi:hypothetical protein
MMNWHCAEPDEHEICWNAHSVEQSEPATHELQLPLPSQTISVPHEVPAATYPIG